MNYKLALKLKEAGFPQDRTNQIKECGGWGGIGGDEDVINPTLSELIKACGNRFAMLAIGQGKWYARADQTCDECAFDEPIAYGETPEEAVANLWLALNKN